MRRQAGKRAEESEDEQVEDVMAWGNRKENYYQQSESEYSQLEDEEQEAKKIYEQQLEDLQHDDLYNLPAKDQNQEVEEEEEDDETRQTTLSKEYLTAEIRRMARLGSRVSVQHDSKPKALLEEYIQAYLMALIALRQLKIAYVEYHPIVAHANALKQDINKLRTLLDTSTHHAEPEEEERDQESDQVEEDGEGENQDDMQEERESQGEQGYSEEEQELQRGLKIYEQAKMRQQQAKRQKKAEGKQHRDKNRKPAFLEVKENEGRLANEKILKNKGLIKKRKKIDRNGRVKLRRKFEKASSKRKAYGHTIRENPGRQYQGERNIKFGRIASTKLK